MDIGRKSGRAFIALVSLCIFCTAGLTSVALAQGNPNGAAGQMPAFHDGELFTVNMKEMPDNSEGPLLAHDPSINKIYASNDLDDPQDFHPVINAIQGEGFNPLWHQILIVFNEGFTPHQFVSEAQVLAAAAGPNPEITLNVTDEVYRSAPPTAYSEDPSSVFFAEAREVYDAVNNRTPEQEAIALFWSDDPGVTATPPGHSISIATQVLRLQRASLMTAAETYAKVGMATADALIACWHAKYRYNLLRPVTYIRSLIDGDWLPLLNTPPFPEHTSGHAVQSGAAFQVLADLFGDRYSFDDHTYDERSLAPRHFDAFSDCAREAAISRLYGGIHFPARDQRRTGAGPLHRPSSKRAPLPPPSLSADVPTCQPARLAPDRAGAQYLHIMILLFHGGQELPAGLLAAPAGLGAHPAVLVQPGMALALVAAALAGGHAGLQQRPGDACVGLGLAAGDPDGGGAHVGAVQAQPDALDQLGQVLLAQVVVGVGGAGLGAVVERADGGGQHAGVDVEVAWVGVQQLPGVAHGALLARRRRGDSARVPLFRAGNQRGGWTTPAATSTPASDRPRRVCHVSLAALLDGLGPTRPVPAPTVRDQPSSW